MYIRNFTRKPAQRPVRSWKATGRSAGVNYNPTYLIAFVYKDGDMVEISPIKSKSEADELCRKLTGKADAQLTVWQ